MLGPIVTIHLIVPIVERFTEFMIIHRTNITLWSNVSLCFVKEVNVRLDPKQTTCHAQKGHITRGLIRRTMRLN